MSCTSLDVWWSKYSVSPVKWTFVNALYSIVCDLTVNSFSSYRKYPIKTPQFCVRPSKYSEPNNIFRADKRAAQSGSLIFFYTVILRFLDVRLCREAINKAGVQYGRAIRIHPQRNQEVTRRMAKLKRLTWALKMTGGTLPKDAF